MNQMMIERYINMLTPGHIKQFAHNEEVQITENEVNVIYDAIKTRYQELLNGNYNVIHNLKDKVSIPVYNKIVELVNKYQHFLN